MYCGNRKDEICWLSPFFFLFEDGDVVLDILGFSVVLFVNTKWGVVLLPQLFCLHEDVYILSPQNNPVQTLGWSYTPSFLFKNKIMHIYPENSFLLYNELSNFTS